MYQPKPLDTSKIELPKELHGLVEHLAENNHDIWAKQRIQEGWSFGARLDDEKKLHPNLIPYDNLSESEKEYDRNSAIETIKLLISLGFGLVKVK